jgi:hypothetical protein
LLFRAELHSYLLDGARHVTALSQGPGRRRLVFVQCGNTQHHE